MSIISVFVRENAAFSRTVFYGSLIVFLAEGSNIL